MTPEEREQLTRWSRRPKMAEHEGLQPSADIAARRGPLAYLTRKGVALDFGSRSELVTDAQGRHLTTMAQVALTSRWAE